MDQRLAAVKGPSLTRGFMLGLALAAALAPAPGCAKRDTTPDAAMAPLASDDPYVIDRECRRACLIRTTAEEVSACVKQCPQYEEIKKDPREQIVKQVLTPILTVVLLVTIIALPRLL